MKNSKLTIQDVRILHQAGDMIAAKNGYLQLLKKNPRSVEIMDWLAILFAQEENYDEAIRYLQKALEIQPKNPLLNLHLANVFKIQGLFSKAAEVLNQSLASHPNHPAALNNLGTIYFSQEKYEAAIDCFNQAIQLEPNYVDAYYNLGLAQIKLNKIAEADQIFKLILEKSENHVGALFHLATNYMRQNKINEAKELLLKIEQNYPNHLETQTNLATCYLKLGALNEAKSHYLNALELSGNDAQILFNSAVILTEQGHLDVAIQYYQRIIQNYPNDFATHNNLGVAFLAKQHLGFALHHFQEALRIQPNNISIAHIVSVLAKDQHLLASPPDYIKSLFDAYADHYDPHLLKALDYQIPAIFFKIVNHAKKLIPQSLQILDLGCGTGLASEPFKPFAERLIGVDLSEKMLAVAAEKKLYDQLFQDDLLHFLKTQKISFDLVIAADTLVYLGELNSLFACVKAVLKPSGLFIFNTEISGDAPFKMNQSGRFSHQQAYLQQLAEDYQFKIIRYEMDVTRLQNNEPVYGHIMLLQFTN